MIKNSGINPRDSKVQGNGLRRLPHVIIVFTVKQMETDTTGGSGTYTH
jgi:hypothetical protein